MNNNVLKYLGEHFTNIYIRAGKTDLRRGIDGLVAIVESELKLDPYSNSMFMFCGTKLDRIKILVNDGEGFVLFYKRLENGKYKWPRDNNEARLLTDKEFSWFCDGLKLEQTLGIKKMERTINY